MLTLRMLLTLVLVMNARTASRSAARDTATSQAIPDWEVRSCRRAPAPGYSCYGTWDGVSFFFRFEQPARDTGRAKGLLGAYNGREERVWVSYTPIWACADGSASESAAQGDSFRPGQSQGGELSGMWYHPCPDGVRITTVRLRARVRTE